MSRIDLRLPCALVRALRELARCESVTLNELSIWLLSTGIAIRSDHACAGCGEAPAAGARRARVMIDLRGPWRPFELVFAPDREFEAAPSGPISFSLCASCLARHFAMRPSP